MTVPDPATLAAFAETALANVDREFPNHPGHVLNHPGDALTPRALHPVFFGSFDWHSAVHMHWLLARVLRVGAAGLGPDRAARVARRLTEAFAPDRVAGEIAYLRQPLRASFERTYGWAWLLELRAELERCRETNVPGAAAWCSGLDPLAAEFVERYLEFLPRAAYPIRSGTHANSAFGFLLALDYAKTLGCLPLGEAVASTSRVWFAGDRGAPAAYEPSGDDFLSPSLVEAALMSRVLQPADFRIWLEGFLPLGDAASGTGLLRPVVSADPEDPKHSHLDGLNLSRAWNWRRLGAALEAGDPRRTPALEAAGRHLAAGLPRATGTGYMGRHWLATFAMLALTPDRP